MAQGKFSQPRNRREEPQAPVPVPDHSDLPTEDIWDPLPEEDFLPEDSLPEDFVDKAIRLFHQAVDFCGKYRKAVLLGMCAASLVLIVSIIGIFFAGSSDPYDGRILNNVLIADTLVGSMTREEAISALESSLAGRYSSQTMVIRIGTTTLRLEPKDVKVKLKVKEAVQAAYDYGRTGTQAQREEAYQLSLTSNHTIALLPYLELDEAYIRGVLNHYVSELGSVLTQSNYILEGEEPDLSTEVFDPDNDGQTLVITMGTPGINFDADRIYDAILDAYSLGRFQVSVGELEPGTEPDPLDLDAIYEELYIAPVDPAIDMNSYEPVPGFYGRQFHLETARFLVKNAGYGEEVRIPMEYIPPALEAEDILYQDVLAQSQTPHSDNKNRTTNLRLACKAINGLELLPGETFSFNNTLGQRTAEKGYKSAPSYASGELVDSIGGGICQVSSTLYWAALLSDMEIVSRTNHGLPVAYMDLGLDATVSWGGPDFKFRNSTSYPIRIEAEVSNVYVKVRILGTEQRQHTVKMETNVTNTLDPKEIYEEFPFDNPEGYADGDVIKEGAKGYTVKTYKCKYDSETGKLISRDYVTTSSYRSQDRVVAKVAPPETEPETQPVTQPTSPSTEATQPSTEAATPSTEATAPKTEPTAPTTETTQPPATSAPETQPSVTESTESGNAETESTAAAGATEASTEAAG